MVGRGHALGRQGLYRQICHEVGLHHSRNTGSQANPVLVVVIRAGASQVKLPCPYVDGSMLHQCPKQLAKSVWYA